MLPWGCWGELRGEEADLPHREEIYMKNSVRACSHLARLIGAVHLGLLFLLVDVLSGQVVGAVEVEGVLAV